MTPILSFFECITCSSSVSLEETKITYSYCFIMIFFFLLKKVPNIPYYSVFDASFSFFSLKRFLILWIVLPSIYFFSLKFSFYIFNNITSYFFIVFNVFFSFMSLKWCSVFLQFCLILFCKYFSISIVQTL